MSTAENESTAATQGPEAPQASGEGEQPKQQEASPSADSVPATNGVKEESSAEEAPTAMETEPAAAAGEESKSTSEATPNGTVKEESKADGNKPAEKKERPRFNSAARKRFRLLLGQGYDREEAARLAQDPEKFKEAREKMGLADKGKKKFDFDEERKTLNGAGKKRLAWLLKNGYNEREAIALARKPVESLKRGRSDGLNGNSAFGPPSKLAKTSASTGTIRMAVTMANHPASVLTKDQSNKVKSGILKQVMQQKDSPLKPHFEDCVFVDGYLRVLCSDQPTVKFLQQNIPKLELWKDASLKVISEKNIAKTDIFVGNFTDSRQDSNKDILSFVECQNDGVSTSQWKILSRKEIPNKQTIELKLTMDPASVKIIHKLGYELNYKFNKIQIQRIKKPAQPSTNAPLNSNRAVVAKNFPVRRNLNPTRSSSFVPIWDNNLPKRAAFNRVPSPPRRSNFDRFSSNQYDSGSRGNWGNGNNSSYNSMNSFNSSGGSGQSSSRPYSLVENLFDQLNRTTGSGNNSFDRYGLRRGNTSSVNNRINSASGRSSNFASGRSSSFASSRGMNSLGNRSFFTTSRLGFF
ncbi:uncharacterized protein LOC131688739 [Topomyia yanbarensis]|uniref:uncharacterized protein LOC131688739 n=1 Tax=Topomyia yanbarensis TaxID=2498891 RepID=UPI00273B0778|nr:uncharacterized protein LOC131688739 [Topomyia yanbarensis]